MKHRLIMILAALSSYSTLSFAQTKIDVPSFENKTAANPCNAVEHWKAGINEAFRFQLRNSLSATDNFTVVEAERMRGEERARLFESAVSTVHKKATFKASQYSIIGTLKTFDICTKKAEVAIEIQVFDHTTGHVIKTFMSRADAPNKTTNHDYRSASFNTGLFKDSPIGRATVSAIADATEQLKQAFPKREVASGEYKVRTIPRSRSR